MFHTGQGIFQAINSSTKILNDIEFMTRNGDEERNVTCSALYYCPDAHTCCLAFGTYACCPLPSGVCCGNSGMQCCPEGAMCIEGNGFLDWKCINDTMQPSSTTRSTTIKVVTNSTSSSTTTVTTNATPTKTTTSGCGRIFSLEITPVIFFGCFFRYTSLITMK